ncbi:MAG TPA: hypothetical protein VF316_02320 [Polyangiaceae bacterium]
MKNAATTKPSPPSDDDDAPPLPADAKPLARRARPTRRLSLANIRKTWRKTQVDVAAGADMAQGDVSKLERRPTDELTLTTLQRYAEALGAHVEVALVFDRTGHRVVVGDPLDRGRIWALLHDDGPMTLGAIAAHFDTEPAGVETFLDELRSLGSVRRRPGGKYEVRT